MVTRAHACGVMRVGDKVARQYFRKSRERGIETSRGKEGRRREGGGRETKRPSEREEKGEKEIEEE